jgi:hypothetical protein
MIFPEGYIPLATVTSDLITAATKKCAVEDPYDPTSTTESREEWGRKIEHFGYFDGICVAWHFCDMGHTPFTMLTNGTVVRISNKLLNNWVVERLGTYVDVVVGTLGSGCGFFDGETFGKDKTRRKHDVVKEAIGPFWGLPVLFLEADVRGTVEDGQGADIEFNKGEHVQIAEQIVAAFDADPTLKKSDAKRQFCIHMKHAEFIATWEMAAKVRPSLSKPGPRGMR